MSGIFICPHCGADVDYEANMCPECGSDETTGWAEGADTVDLLPSEAGQWNAEKSWPWSKIALGIVAVVLAISAMASFGQNGIYLGLLLLAIAIGAVFYYRFFPNSRIGRERELYNELMIATRGDEAMIERWVAYERSRMPDADNIMLMQRALYRWKRDTGQI